MCLFHCKFCIVGQVWAVRPPSVTDSLRGRYHLGLCMKCGIGTSFTHTTFISHSNIATGPILVAQKYYQENYKFSLYKHALKEYIFIPLLNVDLHKNSFS